MSYYLLSLNRALWNLHIVHSPTNALLLNLEKFKIYIKININIAPTCFGLRPSSVIFMLKYSVKLRRYTGLVKIMLTLMDYFK